MDIPIPDPEDELEDPVAYAIAERESKRRLLLDDVPEHIKRTRYQESPTCMSSLPRIAMHAVVHSDKHTKHEGWFDRYQVGGMSALLNKVVRGVHIHSQPRQRLYDHPRHRRFNRLTVMLNQDGQVSMKDDGVERTGTKMAEPWYGLTIFYHDKPRAW